MTDLTPREEMKRLTDELTEVASGLPRPVNFMEVCGTHTVNACRSGVHSLMPDNVSLVSGPAVRSASRPSGTSMR